jgi:3-hydroxyacyl-CoA dehydrogenase
MHFFSPVPVMPIVEIINGLQTSADTLATTIALAQAMGKVHII